MKNRIDNLFTERASDITSVYYPAGYPHRDSTMEVLRALQEGGIDMVELGVPFSDPMADGPVIQAASTQSLENGMTLQLLFEQIAEMRSSGITIPVLLMGYLNPIMHYGFEAFGAKCAEVGIDGMIIPDLPFKEYVAEYKPFVEKYDLRAVMFITPETSDDRLRLIDEHASGFVYMVSTAGTTGSRGSFAESTEAYFTKINKMGLKNPRMIGFGISNAETYTAACRSASGAIVGSHFVKLLKSESTATAAVAKLLSDLKG